MSQTESRGLSRVVDWLREGYPQGIPQEDYVAIFGILHRSLTATEVEQLARELYERSGGADGAISADEIAGLIQQNVLQQPSDTDIRRVAGRLAQGGWPLESVAAPTPAPARRAFLPRIERIVGWLRQGYPLGIPDADFIPLLAVLKRKLTQDELGELADDLRVAGFIPADRQAVAAAYLRITDELADESQLTRVIDRLRAAGIEVDDLDNQPTESTGETR